MIELVRTGHAPLSFEGEEIARSYGRWADGQHWEDYHNLIVYRTSEHQYVMSIEYRAHWPRGEPHDVAVECGDLQAVEEALARYKETATVRPWVVQQRYDKQVAELLQAVRLVESGEAPPPLRLAVVIDWGKIDGDIIEGLEEIGAAEGISAQEVLRRSVEQEFEIEGERGGPVIIHMPDDAAEEPKT